MRVLLLILFFMPLLTDGKESPQVLISEVAWMGTRISANDEWIELYNASDQDINLAGWKIEAQDGSPAVALSGSIPAHGYFLLERSDDTSVPDAKADVIYKGALENGGEHLKLFDASDILIDEVSSWQAGDAKTKQTMERTENRWQTSLKEGGTPKAQNSIVQPTVQEQKIRSGRTKNFSESSLLLPSHFAIALLLAIGSSVAALALKRRFLRQLAEPSASSSDALEN